MSPSRAHPRRSLPSAWASTRRASTSRTWATTVSHESLQLTGSAHSLTLSRLLVLPGEEEDEFAIKALLSHADRFKDAERFPVQCQKCGTRRFVPPPSMFALRCVVVYSLLVLGVVNSSFPGMYVFAGNSSMSGLHCTVEGCDGIVASDTGADMKPSGKALGLMEQLDVANTSLANSLMLSLRKHVMSHMEGCVWRCRWNERGWCRR